MSTNDTVRVIREELGYEEPVEMETALSGTVDWELANPPEEIDPKEFDYAAEDLALADTVSHVRAIKVGRSVATGL